MRIDFERIGRWVLSHKLLVLALIGVLSTVSLYYTFQAPLRTSIIKGFLANDQQYRAYRESAEALGGNADDLVYVATKEGPELLSADKLNAVRAAVEELEAMPEVSKVFSLVNAPFLAPRRMSVSEIAGRSVIRKQIEQGRVPDISPNTKLPTYWPQAPPRDTNRWLEQLRGSLPEQDPFAQFFLSNDQQTQAMLIVLHNAGDLETTVQENIRLRVREIVLRHGLGKNGYYATGILVTQAWMLNQAATALMTLFPIGVAIIFLLVYLVFGRIVYTLLTLAIALVAITWAFGVTSAVFGEVSILVAASPLLILVIATADTIHLSSAYVEEIKRGVSKEEAVLKVFQEVGGACLLTSITTFLGFLSLAVVPASTIRHVSLALAVGVASALLLALTLVPITLSVLPAPNIDRTPFWSRWLDRAMDAGVNVSRRIVVRSPKLTVFIHGIILITALVVTQRIVLDVNFSQRFNSSHSFRRSVEFFQDELYGTNSIEVVIRGKEDAIFRPESLRMLAALEEKILQLKGVDRVLSLPTLYRTLGRSLATKWKDGLPEKLDSAVALVRLVEQWSPDTVTTLVSRAKGLTRMRVNVDTKRILEIHELSEQIEQIANETVRGADLSIQMAGSYPVLGRAVKHIIRTQFHGFMICFCSVMFVIAVGIRSIRTCLLAAVPNLLPLLMLGLLVGLTTPVMDTDILGVAIVSFGLAVDDTIHFLHRFELERKRGLRVVEAIDRTFQYTGRAIIRTTVVLGVGLLPFSLSGYLSIWLLGTYLVFVLAMAVIGDLLLLPALLLLFSKESGDVRPKSVSRQE